MWGGEEILGDHTRPTPPGPLIVVSCGVVVGLLVVVPTLPPCGMVWVRVVLWWLPLASLGLLCVFGILIPMMMIMMMG